MIIILFGEMGVGKSYIGKRLAESMGALFLEGDDCLPDNLKSAVVKAELLTKADALNFVQAHLIPAIEAHMISAAEQHKDLVVTQALYDTYLRDMIKAHFGEQIVQFIQVVPPSVWQQMRWLLSRSKGWKWVLNALVSRPYFKAAVDKVVFRNGSEKDIENQIKVISLVRKHGVRIRSMNYTPVK